MTKKGMPEAQSLTGHGHGCEENDETASTGHDKDEPTGAEYFTLHAGIALDDVRDPVTGFDAEGLERLRSAAVAFLASLPVPADGCHCHKMVPGAVCERCPFHGGWDEGTLCESCQGATASDVSPLPTVAQWATS